jgi:DnaJ family protein C protein 17
MTSTFGPVDGDSIVLSMKAPKKKAAAAPPKYAIAAVPFKTVADAHAAVCASRRADRGLDEFEIAWMGGCEPAVWSWAERMLKLKEERAGGTGATGHARPAPADGAKDPAVPPASTGISARDGLPQDSGAPSGPAASSQFSSFPSSFVRSRIFCLADFSLTTLNSPAFLLLPHLHPNFPLQASILSPLC